MAEIITDGEKERSFLFYKKPFNKDTSLNIELKPYGGFAGKLMDFKEAGE